VNKPCGHRLMCMPCGDRRVCNVCLQPSTVEPFQPREPFLVCVVCGELWGPRTMFIPGSCGHVLCVGCTSQVARDAHHDRTKVTAGGLPCGYSGCQTRLARDVVQTLFNSRTRAPSRGTRPGPSSPCRSKKCATSSGS
jgi:hypothetical protein